MMKHRQDLGGCREMFVQSKVETEARVKQMEEQNRAKDDERRESEQALLAAEEYRRSLEVKLREAQRRSEWMRETDAQIAENERARHDYLHEVKRRADSEKVGACTLIPIPLQALGPNFAETVDMGFASKTRTLMILGDGGSAAAASKPWIKQQPCMISG
jgi:hypothetical protein